MSTRFERLTLITTSQESTAPAPAALDFEHRFRDSFKFSTTKKKKGCKLQDKSTV